MLKLYIVDDDIAVIKSLENIIEDNDLGNIVGASSDGEEAIVEIKRMLPDIVIVDLLMPMVDGIELVHRIKTIGIDVKFVMISQVNSKKMIEKAYDKGIDFFISKPINIIEIIRVLKNVSETIELKKKLKTIENVFKDTSIQMNYTNSKTDELQDIKIILNKLGIMGEKGAEDIIGICSYLIETNSSIFDYKIKEICNETTENSTAAEQRIRRAINKGLSNIAHLGLEDYMNEVFTRYSNTLFNFEDVKAEMDYIRGKKKSGGRISIRKFIDSLMTEKYMNIN
ncbi:response regulator [Clostridium sp. D2Q-11]|uniref:Response regulator n=1 Tax=Anaeromonas frigoriresistens TaxID=2683708 RepID=A0A942Z9B3_9FIRM|nr:response regulator [Anaeromonas frigoriresistens]MBS4538700.1 response regulator [Anaeromonas frigoriresistens]